MIEPDFSPGAGWHRIEGMRIPGCASDLEDRARRAYRCCVLPMRARGERIAPDALLGIEPVRGALVMQQPAGTYWTAFLYDDETVRKELMRITDARLLRDHDGCRLYQGRDLENSALRWPQTWLCTPTAERAIAIVQTMAERRF